MFIITRIKDDEIILLTKDEKEVDSFQESAILTYYEAAKLFSKVSKTATGFQMVNLLEVIFESSDIKEALKKAIIQFA